MLPEIFVGDDDPERTRFVLVEPNRNLLLGVAIMVGFMTFVATDKTLRIATGGGAGSDHSHERGGANGGEKLAVGEGFSSSVDIRCGETVIRRGATPSDRVNGVSDGVAVHDKHGQVKEMNPSVKLSGYLNLM